MNMRCERGLDSAALIRTSQRLLSRHKAQKAIVPLRKAVDLCSIEDRAQLERALYWLSIALIRVGKSALAIKALANARHLVPRGKCAVLYKRLTNDYGMPKSSCCDHDDYQAFFSIQLRRYLATVPGQKFESSIEMDTILELIASAWIKFKRDHAIESMECGEKVRQYEGLRMSFPQLRQVNSSKCCIFAFKAYKGSHEFSKHKRVCMPWESDTV